MPIKGDLCEIFIDANEGPCRLMRSPVEIFLISHFVFKLSNDFKCQFMTSFCLQIIRILYGEKLYLYFWKVTVLGDILAEQNECNKHCFIN